MADTAQTVLDLEAARCDSRFPVVLQEIRSFVWATGSPTPITGDHAELLAARVLAVIRRHTTPEGPTTP